MQSSIYVIIFLTVPGVYRGTEQREVRPQERSQLLLTERVIGLAVCVHAPVKRR